MEDLLGLALFLIFVLLSVVRTVLDRRRRSVEASDDRTTFSPFDEADPLEGVEPAADANGRIRVEIEQKNTRNPSPLDSQAALREQVRQFELRRQNRPISVSVSDPRDPKILPPAVDSLPEKSPNLPTPATPAMPNTERSLAETLSAALREPAEIKKAVLLSEILRRPEERW